MCGPTALAMLLDRPLSEILDRLGHDGSEIWWPGLDEPRNRRGFMFDEFIDVADSYGQMLCPIVSEPAQWNGSDLDSVKILKSFPFGRDTESRIQYYMSKFDGLIIGNYAMHKGHMAAWDSKNRKVYDPSPKHGVYDYDSATEYIITDIFLARIKSGYGK